MRLGHRYRRGAVLLGRHGSQWHPIRAVCPGTERLQRRLPLATSRPNAGGPFRQHDAVTATRCWTRAVRTRGTTRCRLVSARSLACPSAFLTAVKAIRILPSHRSKHDYRWSPAEALSRALQRWPELHNPRAWVWQVAYNHVRRWWRRIGTHEVLTGGFDEDVELTAASRGQRPAGGNATAADGCGDGRQPRAAGPDCDQGPCGVPGNRPQGRRGVRAAEQQCQGQ